MKRIRLDYVQFGAVFEICKGNPMVGALLGYTCQAHMTPEQFIRATESELVDEEVQMNAMNSFVTVSL